MATIHIDGTVFWLARHLRVAALQSLPVSTSGALRPNQ
jgi:hypothetical protein